MKKLLVAPVFSLQLVFFQVLPGQIVINEIMADPSDGQPEWIELANMRHENISLGGWIFSDMDTVHGVEIPPSAMIQADGFLVLCADSSLFQIYEELLGPVAVTDRFPRLNNDSDGIIVRDTAGVLADRVHYHANWGGGDGISLERISCRGESDFSGNWGSSIAFAGATPGSKNSIYAEGTLKDAANLEVFPNPFSPDGDRHEDVATISYFLSKNSACINLRIYNMQGQLVRTLLGAVSSGSERSVSWDGRDDNGRPVPMGVYLIHLEAVDHSCRCDMAKTTVVVAGAL